MLTFLWLIPFLPLAGFLLNGLFGARWLPRRAVAFIACAAVLASFALSVAAFMEMPEGHAPPRFTQDLFTWMPLGATDGGGFEVRWAYHLDPLSAVMILVVTGVGFLIHVYSIGYMAAEPQAAYARFFAYLNLFMAMMLT
ncbi:MAG: NADH-quinone oxidoreductase subunit L, partial [Candidatus Polarisedimenticolia bacterium]